MQESSTLDQLKKSIEKERVLWSNGSETFLPQGQLNWNKLNYGPSVWQNLETNTINTHISVLRLHNFTFFSQGTFKLGLTEWIFGRYFWGKKSGKILRKKIQTPFNPLKDPWDPILRTTALENTNKFIHVIQPQAFRTSLNLPVSLSSLPPPIQTSLLHKLFFVLHVFRLINYGKV